MYIRGYIVTLAYNFAFCECFLHLSHVVYITSMRFDCCYHMLALKLIYFPVVHYKVSQCCNRVYYRVHSLSFIGMDGVHDMGPSRG